MAESVKEYGTREPGLARPRADGGYELLCGNRRKRACELARVAAMPVIVRELDDNLAAIVMKQDGKLTSEAIDRMLSEEKKPPKGEPTGSARYRRFFPPSYSPKQIDDVIVELLTDWKARVAA